MSPQPIRTQRNIVLLSDGTGNSRGKVFRTNVWRVYEALDLADPAQPEVPRQFAFYDDGVGNSSFKPLAVLGGALGYGLARNVRDLYAFLCRMYQPGDRIYAFGFSRGAFTIRVLVGLISHQGIVRYTGDEAELLRLVKAAYRAYRRRYTLKINYIGPLRDLRDAVLSGWARLRGKTPYAQASADNFTEVPIEFVGLWDTVAAYLAKLDRGFNDRYGLFDLDGKRVDTVSPDGRVLLIIHGTFSKCDAIIGQLNAMPDGTGRQLLAAARAKYKQVLVFEHPTLAVGPLLNALDLARAFPGSAAQVDIICHSRGGLVTRWWLEVLSRQIGASARVIFCGAPMMGTGLASPYRLRTALKMLTNMVSVVQNVAELAALAVPLFAVVQGLMALVASATSLLAKTPIADTAVAMVPGLAAMSRFGPDGGDFISGNYELEKLSFGWTTPPTGYFSISSNFETEDPGWRFWRNFRTENIADIGTDWLFAGANDLVVDTDSMTRMTSTVQIMDPTRRLEYGTNSVVHHLNYFSQPKTVQFIRSSLGI